MRFRSLCLRVFTLAAIILIGGEIGARLLLSAQMPSDQFLFWSDSLLTSSKHDGVHFHPAITARWALVSHEKIEYDYTFATNPQGYADWRDYPLQAGTGAARSIAMLGDSFLVGHGFGAWIPWLNQRHPDAQMYNFGMIGIGVEQMRERLQRAAKKFPVDEVVILLISNDFYRSDWRPLPSTDAVRICPPWEADSTCGKREPIAFVMPFDLSQDDILSRARVLSAERSERFKNLYRGWGTLRQLRIVDILWRLAVHEPLTAGGEGRQVVSPLLLNRLKAVHIQALHDIKKDVPDLPFTILHIPERHEVADARYLLAVDEMAAAAGIRYVPLLTACPGWSVTMFHTHDPHPNEQGYAHLAACVEQILFTDQAPQPQPSSPPASGR